MTTAADDAAVEDAFEALLSGRPVPERAAGLAAFTQAVRGTATAPGRPNAALAELLATGLLVDQSSPSTRTARSAGALPSRRPRNRKRSRFAMILSALLAKIVSAGAVAQAAAGAGVVLVAVTGAGAAGVLPGPVQDTFTSIVSDETEAPVEEAPVDELLQEPVEEPAEEPLVEEPVVEDAAAAVEAWMVGPIDGSFGAWVSAARHDPMLRAAIEATGRPFGYYVSQRAHEKGMTEEELAEEGVDLDELDGATDDGTVVEEAPEDGTAEDETPETEVAETERTTEERGGRGNDDRNGNAGGNGNGRN